MDLILVSGLFHFPYIYGNLGGRLAGLKHSKFKAIIFLNSPPNKRSKHERYTGALEKYSG
jgi:hypothetical protein